MPPASVRKPLVRLAPHPRPRARKVFEISLVRESLRRLTAGRRGCVHCHRTPLVGETVFLYGERLVCELCRPLRREAPGGEAMVHSPERGHSVRPA